MDLAARTRWTLRHYWADRLGVAPGAFDGGVSVGAADEGGVQLFERGDALVVGAPDPLVEDLRGRAADAPSVADAAAVREWVPAPVGEVLGPTFYGYTDREAFEPVDAEARVLRPPDEPAHDQFRAAVTEAEWRQGAPGFEAGRTVGAFVGERLVATAGWEVWDDLFAHLGVVTHPDYRNRGYGRAVVSLATERALGEGLLPQYRTLDEWSGSVRLAEGLGYERFVTAALAKVEE
ncbi:MAG: GNAT family N-acetyltransferase [Halobacteriaceae archaeon]